MSFLRQIVPSLFQAVKQRLRQWIRDAALDLAHTKSELVLKNAWLRQPLIVLQSPCYAGIASCFAGCGSASRGHNQSKADHH